LVVLWTVNLYILTRTFSPQMHKRGWQRGIALIGVFTILTFLVLNVHTNSPSGLTFYTQALVNSCPTDIADNSNLDNDLTSNGSCIHFTANNIELDCEGFTITGNGSGIGINATERNNITIKNCNLHQFNTSIVFLDTNNSKIMNTTALNSSRDGILIGGTNNNITNNTFKTNEGTERFEGALVISGTEHRAQDNILHNPNGTGLLVIGTLDSGAVITLPGTNTSNNLLRDNHASSSNGAAIYLLGNASNNTLINNTGSSNAAEGIGLGGFLGFMGGGTPAPQNNTLINNTFTTGGGVGTAGGGPTVPVSINTRDVIAGGIAPIETQATISLNGGDTKAAGNTFNGNTLFIAAGASNARWITMGIVGDTNDFTNTRFQRPGGYIHYTGTQTYESDDDTDVDDLNVSSLRAFVNSSTSILNDSAIIKWFNVSFDTLDDILVDFNDNGTFEPCPGSICTFISLTDNMLTFNVSHFTTYTANGTNGTINVTLNKTDSFDPVNASAQLNYTITVNITSGDLTNVTITDTLPVDVTFVNASPAPDNGTNTTFSLGNLTDGNVSTITITVTVGDLDNETIIINTANMSFQNSSGGTISLGETENTTILSAAEEEATTPASGGGSASRNAGQTGICPSYCRDERNNNVLICQSDVCQQLHQQTQNEETAKTTPLKPAPVQTPAPTQPEIRPEPRPRYQPESAHMAGTTPGPQRTHPAPPTHNLTAIVLAILLIIGVGAWEFFRE